MVKWKKKFFYQGKTVKFWHDMSFGGGEFTMHICNSPVSTCKAKFICSYSVVLCLPEIVRYQYQSDELKILIIYYT